MRINEVMSRAVATIEASESAHAAIGRMLARKIRHLPAVDAQGTLAGIVTDRDLRHFLSRPESSRRSEAFPPTLSWRPRP